MARHAQEERPLRNCHDSSDSPGGICGAGLFAQAPAGYITPARRRIAAGASAELSAIWTGSESGNTFVSAHRQSSGKGKSALYPILAFSMTPIAVLTTFKCATESGRKSVGLSGGMRSVYRSSRVTSALRNSESRRWPLFSSVGGHWMQRVETMPVAPWSTQTLAPTRRTSYNAGR
jgi:hypothetical protein